VAWRMLVLGVGLGPGQSLFALAVQNAMPISRLGVVTSSSQFFRQIGSTVGTALFGALLTARLAGEMAAHGEGGPQSGLAQLQALAIGGEGGAHPLAGAGHIAVDPIVRLAFSASMTSLFDGALIVVGLGLLAIIAIPHVELRKHHVHAEPVAEPGEGAAGIVEA